MNQLAGAVDIDDIAPGACGGAKVDAAAVDQDGGIGITRRLLDGAVANCERAAVDENGWGIGGGLSSHSLKNQRAPVEGDGRRVARDDRSIGESDGASVDDEVARGGAPFDGDMSAVDGPVDRSDAGRYDHGAARDRRVSHGRVPAGGGQVNLHVTGGGDWRGRCRARTNEVECDRHRAAGIGSVDRLHGRGDGAAGSGLESDRAARGWGIIDDGLDIRLGRGVDRDGSAPRAGNEVGGAAYVDR